MTNLKTLFLAAAVAAIGTTGAMAQDAMKSDKMTTGDKMAAHDSMSSDSMSSGKKMTKSQMKKHDAMMKKHDAMMKKDSMSSSKPM